jgi:hypothetical protein
VIAGALAASNREEGIVGSCTMFQPLAIFGFVRTVSKFSGLMVVVLIRDSHPAKLFQGSLWVSGISPDYWNHSFL